MTEIDMDNFVSILDPWAEMIYVFLDIYCRSFRKYFMVIVFLVDLLRRDIDIVQIISAIQVDM